MVTSGRIAELRLVVGVIRQRPKRAPRAPMPYVETESIGAGLKVHAAVRDTTIEQRVVTAPHVEQTSDVEPTCLDVPLRRPPDTPPCGLTGRLWPTSVSRRSSPNMPATALPVSDRRADSDACWPRESGGANRESQESGPRGRDHVGMQSHSIPKVEIESLQSQQRPDADVNHT